MFSDHFNLYIRISHWDGLEDDRMVPKGFSVGYIYDIFRKNDITTSVILIWVSFIFLHEYIVNTCLSECIGYPLEAVYTMDSAQGGGGRIIVDFQEATQ